MSAKEWKVREITLTVFIFYDLENDKSFQKYFMKGLEAVLGVSALN